MADAVPDGLLPGGRVAEWSPRSPAYVALDVDGTLVRGGPVPDARILTAIGGLVGRGVRVGLATGRMAAATDAILATGMLTGPHVFHNGAVVADGDGSERVVLGLDDDDVAAILELGRGRDDLTVEVYVGRTYLADRDDPRSAAHARLLGVAPAGRIATVSDLEGRTAIKAVLVCYGSAAAREAASAVTALGLAAGPAASPATPELRYVNVTRGGVDKGSGVAMAAELIGVELATVAALGDEVNDLPVLARVGTAIAIGGSAREVTARAHLVAPGFDADGCAVALEALARLAPVVRPQRAPGTW